LDEPSRSVGVYRHTKPVISEIPIVEGILAIVFTDGLRHAGTLSGKEAYDPVKAMDLILAAGMMNAQSIADTLLKEAVERDDGRPRDDISVLVISVTENENGSQVRRLNGTIPL
jgi:serine/threonine protein phosphatase PrpC